MEEKETTTVRIKKPDDIGTWKGIVTGKNKKFAKVTVDNNGVFCTWEFSWEAIMRSIKTGKALRVS